MRDPIVRKNSPPRRPGAARSLFDEPAPAFDGEPLGEHSKPVSLEGFTARVAALFKAQPNTWIDGRTIMTIAGSYGWRTRVSNCRQAPYFMRIDNRQRHVGGVVVSEYRFVPDEAQRLGGVA